MLEEETEQGGATQGGSVMDAEAGAGVAEAGSRGSGEPSVASIAGIRATFDGEPNPDEPWSFADSWFMTGCLEKIDYLCRWGVPNNADFISFEGLKGGITTQLFPLGGEAGASYLVHFKFNAIAEAHEYQDGERDQGDQTPEDVDNALIDSFHRGGSAIPSSYNVWRLRVLDSDKQELARYYMNSFPPGQGFLSHRTFLLSYEKDIEVPGQGFIEYMIQDANWGSIDNCGPGLHDTSECEAPRLLPNEPELELPAKYAAADFPGVPADLRPLAELNVMGPPSQPWRSQVGHLVVTSVSQK